MKGLGKIWGSCEDGRRGVDVTRRSGEGGRSKINEVTYASVVTSSPAKRRCLTSSELFSSLHFIFIILNENQGSHRYRYLYVIDIVYIA
jgi:hypothetical protein